MGRTVGASTQASLGKQSRIDGGGAQVMDCIGFNSGTGATTSSVGTGVVTTFPKNQHTLDGSLNQNGGSWGGPGNGWDSGVNNDLGESAGSYTAAEHTHTVSVSGSISLTNTTHTHGVTLDVRPPYYALFFIQKL